MKQVTLGLLSTDEFTELEETFLPLVGLLSDDERNEKAIRLVRGGSGQVYDRAKQESLLRVLAEMLLVLSNESSEEHWKKIFHGNDFALEHVGGLAEMRRVSAEKIMKLIFSISKAHLDPIPNEMAKSNV